MGKLREEMIRYMVTRGYSPKTVKSYTSCVSVLAHFFDKSPLEITSIEVEAFFLSLRERGRREATIRLYYEAIKFFYRSHGILNRVPIIRFHKEADRLPRILSPNDVGRLLSSCTNLKFRTLFSVIYSSGLRISEALNLTITDLDFSRNLIFVRAGKNGKDRHTILANSAKDLLTEYITRYQPKHSLFYAADREITLSQESVRRVFKRLIENSGLDQNLKIHTLRHCFATHSVEHGTSLFHVMKLLGHAHIQTTMKYLHMRSPEVLGITSPLDTLQDSLAPFSPRSEPGFALRSA